MTPHDASTGPSLGAGIERVFAALFAGETVHDDDFDRVYPEWVSDASHTHWTPVRRAQTAARWLVERGLTRVLDVGSGAGKFALVAACTAASMRQRLVITGIEHRAPLAALANSIASHFALSSVRFEVGDALDADWSAFDAVYLYNPFVENLFHPSVRVDRTMHLNGERYVREVAEARARLCTMREGAVAIAFHGYGGAWPADWASEARDVLPDGVLELLRKTG